jgi:hypothetical protein
MSSKKNNVEEIPAIEGQKSTKRFVKVVVRKGLRSKIDRRRGRYRVKTKEEKELERKLKEKKAKRDAKKALKDSPEYKLLLKQLQELQKKLVENETKEKKLSSSGRYYGATRGVGVSFGPQQSGASKEDVSKLLKEQQEKLQKQFEEFKESFKSDFIKKKKQEDDFEANFEYGQTFSNAPKNTKRTPTPDINIRYAPFSDEPSTTERIVELDEGNTEIKKLQPESKIKPRGLRSLTYKPNLQIPQPLEPTPQTIQEPEPQPQPIPHRQSHQQAQEQTKSNSRRYIPATTPEEMREKNRLEIEKLEKENEEIKLKIRALVDDYNRTLDLKIADEPPTPDEPDVPEKINPSITPSKIQLILSRFGDNRQYGIIVEKLREIRTSARQLQANRTSISEKKRTL